MKRISQLLPLLFILFAFGVGSCATTYSFERENPDVMAQYISKPAEKALAVFRISGSNYGYGFGENYDTVDEAKERALEECRERQLQHDDVDDPCKIYMVNNEKVVQEDAGGGN